MKNEKKRIVLLIGIMGAVTLAVGVLVFMMLYQAAFKEQEKRMVETVQSHARMMETIMQHEILSHKGDIQILGATVVELLIEGHYRYKALSKTFEFKLARQEGDQIIFLLNYGLQERIPRKPVSFDSNLAEPMRRALSGKSGTLVGLDYKGVMVLAAHEPVAILNLGLVAKIDLSEIRAPFIKAGMIVTGFGIVLILLGSWLFFKVSEPIHVQLQEQLQQMEMSVTSLKDSEDQFKRIIRNNADAIVVTINGIIRFANPTAEKIFGRSVPELVGKDIGFPVLEKESVDIQILHPSGEQVMAIMSAAQIEWEKNPAYLISLHDITERIKMAEEQKKLEQQLVQAQKMESIGTLAGGIAHDFNNILFPILGYAELLLMDTPEDSPFKDSLNQIYTSALRAKDLVKQILTFSRQDSSELILMKIQPVVKEALKLIRSTIPTTIEIKQDINPDCGVIKADPTQIHQIVMNFATNAYHAMEETGGEMKVSLKQMEFKTLDLINPNMAPGIYACLTVADTGVGMDKNLTDKIFDPFFTTKAVGKGTGMGLSVVHGIVTAMGGAIHVYSEPGKGTQFHVYLPVEKSLSETQVTNSKAQIQGGTEQILLVDDEEAILIMEKRMLERLGYQVTSRISSLEALEAFRNNPDRFDLVITDMAMPSMPGDRLSIELTKIRPGISILLCSGFSENMSKEKAASLGIKGFLFKPIVMKDLAQKIREVLDKN